MSAKFRILEIVELKFEYNTYQNDYESSLDKIQISGNAKEEIGLDDNQIGILFKTNFVYRAPNKEEQIILRSDIAMIFEVLNLVDFAQNQDELYLGLLPQLLGITISSARGIIFSRTKGEIINRVILPILNPTDIMRDRYEKVKKEQENA